MPGPDAASVPETVTTSQTVATSEPHVDGRTARGLRTREAVVDALLALQEEGDLEPTAQRVAARAGVALRTVFGHFSDMETLWAEAGQRELAKLTGLAQPVDPSLPRPQRVTEFCGSRARVLETLLPVMRAARLREHTSPQLLTNRRLFIEAGDAEAEQVFGPELEALDHRTRARRLDALYLAVSASAWEALRHDRGLSVQDATTVMRRLVGAVLAD